MEQPDMLYPPAMMDHLLGTFDIRQTPIETLAAQVCKDKSRQYPQG